VLVPVLVFEQGIEHVHELDIGLGNEDEHEHGFLQ